MKSDEIALDPTQLTTVLVAAVKAKPPLRVLIKGEPGIGKTKIVQAVAAFCGAVLITMHPSVSDPTDFKGLPFIIDGKAEFMPFSELEKVLNAKTLTILFMDDLGQGSTAVQAAVMQLLDRLLGNPNVVVIAATNERNHKAGVSGLLEPVKSRFTSIIRLVTNFPSWRKWAVDNDMDYRTMGYLEEHPDALHKFDATADLVNQPMPRTWEGASNILKMELGDEDARFAMLVGAIGEGTATGFKAWLMIAEGAPSREEVIADPKNTRVPEEISAVYAIASSLSLSFVKKEFAAICVYAQRMYEKEHGDICAMMFKDIYRKDETVQQTPAWTALSNTPLAKLILEAVRFNQQEKK